MADIKSVWDRFTAQSRPDSFRSALGVGFAGKTVLVAGGGGYIGSALVTTLAPEKLRSIILLDSSEHGLFETRRQIETLYPGAPCQYVLGSVADTRLLAAVFRRFRPQIVFHAAAFKHVGVLEHNPFAAIENNVLGTYKLVRAALDHVTANIVLVSTDKAAKPHSVMGVSKRIAELITLSLSCTASPACAIRLGNVIASTGSVLPIFLDQIAKGGPVLVTHPKASRYFLSREEAVSAILAAGAAACAGRVVLPELGEPLLVLDLAKFLIEEHSKTESTPIHFAGLQPGEKLTEDLLGDNETRVGTVDGPLTLVKTETISPRQCEEAVDRLSSCVAQRDMKRLLQSLSQFVPEYVPSKLMWDHAAAAP